MNREELKSMFDALRNDPHHHLGLGDIRLTVAQQDLILDAIDDPLPPAEGAEEILKKHMNGRAVQEYKEELFIEYNTVVAAMQEFASLHAQRLAEKMVSERLREELIAYDKFLSNTYWGVGHIVKRDEAVDEYLKSRER